MQSSNKWRANKLQSNKWRKIHKSRQSPLVPIVSKRKYLSVAAGWDAYLPHEKYKSDGITARRIELLKLHLLQKQSPIKCDEIREKQFYKVDYSVLLDNEELIEKWPDIKLFIKENPELFIAYLGVALHQLIDENAKLSKAAPPGEDVPVEELDFPLIPMLHPRVINYEPVLHLKHLKANCYGKFVAVKGTVVRVGAVKPLCIEMGFNCLTCACVQLIKQIDGRYTTPTVCSSSECNSRSFTPDRNNSRNIDWQIIRLQEIIVDDQKEGGRIPRTVECELKNDLVDSCVPGDIVTVCGVVKVNYTEDSQKKGSSEKSLYSLYIQANSLTNAKGRAGDTNLQIGIEFSVKDLYAIKAIQAEPNLLKLLVSSLCPSIYGHELVKVGLILGLFGGSTKYFMDRNKIPVRGDPHILVVGDPGLGKSQMLQSCANVAPRGVYVCGNTTTVSGLTVTLGKEGSGNDYALEAGALVLADQGCCCIDEFDKMTTQHQALLEAMEQQSISIAKAGILCSLPSRTSILAAANPFGGHYSQAKTVSENLKIGGALLSRFDLVFILLDKPDEDLDTRLSEHIMSIHTRKNRSQITSTSNTSSGTRHSDSTIEDQCLSEQLKMRQGESLDLIPHQLIRKYIAYARKYVQPRLTTAAARVLQSFYLDLRKNHHSFNSTPITTRQLESLIRLSEARAKLELREEVTEKDALDVIEVMKSSMLDTYSNGLGLVDFTRSTHGSGMSQRNQSKKFISFLHAHSDQISKSVFTVEEMKTLARSINIMVADFGGFIDSLNNQGYLLKKGPKLYQLQISDYSKLNKLKQKIKSCNF